MKCYITNNTQRKRRSQQDKLSIDEMLYIERKTLNNNLFAVI